MSIPASLAFATPRQRASILGALVVVMALLSAVFVHAAGAASEQRKMLTFDTMVGNPRPYVGAAGAIRGVNAGGLPWVIADAKGDLRVNGDLKVRVSGLVIDPNDPAAIANGVAGVNPAPAFRAIVSCLSIDTNGVATTVNVQTDAFPATRSGDARIDATVALPDPCIAPIVFVTSPTGSWFASTGF